MSDWRSDGEEMGIRTLTIFLTIVAVLVVTTNPVSAIKYIPAVPDKSKTLPAHDGEPNGCNSSRFQCVLGGEAVLDKQTGLIWARNAYIAEKKMSWSDAVKFCDSIEIGNRKGWRLPTKKEMISLLDTSQSSPALPVGHPFMNVGTVGCTYWTNTEQKWDNKIVWIISLNLGKVQEYLKIFGCYTWPVLESN